jgi:hypothetical protein
MEPQREHPQELRVAPNATFIFVFEFLKWLQETTAFLGIPSFRFMP